VVVEEARVSFFLRLFAPVFLVVNASLYLSGLADPFFLGIATLLACLGGRKLKKWKFLPALGVLASGWLAFRLVLFLMTLFWPQTVGFWDAWPQAWSRQATLVLLPYLLFGTTSYLVSAHPRLLPWERLLNALLLAGVFWLQGGYKMGLYPHPAIEALSVAVFLIFEGLVLYFSSRPRTFHKIRRGLGGLTIPFVLMVFLSAGFLWSLLGHYEQASTSTGGGLLRPQAFQFDFSPLVQLQSRISLGDKLILLYREDGQPQRRYLRRFVLSDYSASKGFFVDPSDKPLTVGSQKEVFSIPPEQAAVRTRIQQEYYLVNLDPSSFLALNAPTSVVPLSRWDHSSFVGAYRVISRVPADALWQVDTIQGFGLPPAEFQKDTDFGGQAWIQKLAQSVTGPSETPFEKTLAIETYLKQHFWYSLEPGSAPDGNQLKYFLTTTKKGYCTYFAFAMALMLRSVGVPARVAVGFFTNPEEGLLGFYPVRALQAHAWVEVPFAGWGWIPFDPTSDRPAPGENFANPPVLSPAKLASLIEEILKADPQPTAVAQKSRPATPNFWENLWQTTNRQWQTWWWLDLLGGYVTVILLFPLGFRLLWQTADPRRRTELLYRRARQELTADLRLPEGQTPLETAAALSSHSQRALASVEFSQLVHELLAARYASSYTKEQSRRAWEIFLQGRPSRRTAAPKRFLLFIFFPFLRGWL
jgi:transglutaminase-like putative cysteine protease